MAKHEPTEENRQRVFRGSKCGVKRDDLCQILGIGRTVFEKYYYDAFEKGRIYANETVAEKLYEQCMEGNVTALIFWLKARAKWRETDVRLNINANAGSNLSAEELVERFLSETQSLSDSEVERLAQRVGGSVGADGGAADGGLTH